MRAVGLSLNGRRWISGDSKFLLPVAVLSPVFRGQFMDLLRKALKSRSCSFTVNLRD